MNPDLMRAARSQPTAEQGQADARRVDSAKPLEDRLAWRTRTRDGNNGLSFLTAARQIDVDRAARHVDAAVNDGQVLFFGSCGRQGSLKRGMHRRGFGNDQ